MVKMNINLIMQMNSIFWGTNISPSLPCSDLGNICWPHSCRWLGYFWYVLSENEDQVLADEMALLLERLVVPTLFFCFYAFLIVVYVTSTTIFAPHPGCILATKGNKTVANKNSDKMSGQ
jgi:hypothetical protein